MRRHCILHRGRAPPERLSLDGPLSLGGPGGALRPGALPAALALSPSAAGVIAEARAAGVRAAGRPLAPGARRLLRPGERAEHGEARVEVEPEPELEGTRALAGTLLREAADGGHPVAAAHLLVLDGPQAGRRLALGGDQTLGRGRAATARLPDPEISRVHVRVTVDGARVRIEDLSSKNGVRVNGAPLGRDPRALAPGDEIGVGATSLVLVAALGAGPLAAGLPPPLDAPPPAAGARRLRLFAAAASLLAASAALGMAAAAGG